jgi:hypothetical protein
VCVDILRINLGAPEKNDRVSRRKECYVSKPQDRGTCIDVVLRLLFRANKLWWGGGGVANPANLITLFKISAFLAILPVRGILRARQIFIY